MFFLKPAPRYTYKYHQISISCSQPEVGQKTVKHIPPTTAKWSQVFGGNKKLKQKKTTLSG